MDQRFSAPAQGSGPGSFQGKKPGDPASKAGAETITFNPKEVERVGVRQVASDLHKTFSECARTVLHQQARFIRGLFCSRLQLTSRPPSGWIPPPKSGDKVHQEI